jgi:N6-adenosine-specific RNA methylase IME4
MTTEDICAMPVSSVAHADAVLLLWATWPCLPDAMAVIHAWGFEYVTGMPWIKLAKCEQDLWGEWNMRPQYGTGFWVRGCSEPILICRRGNVKPPTNGFVGLIAPNVRHSRKPDNVHEYAEALPGPRLELFARRARPGWTVWGNEVEANPTGQPRAVSARSVGPGCSTLNSGGSNANL